MLPFPGRRGQGWFRLGFGFTGRLHLLCSVFSFEFAFSFFGRLAPAPARLSLLTHTPFVFLAGSPAKPREPGRVPQVEPTSQGWLPP